MAKTRVISAFGDNSGQLAYLSPRGRNEDWYELEHSEWMLDPPLVSIYGKADAERVRDIMDKIIKYIEEEN